MHGALHGLRLEVFNIISGSFRGVPCRALREPRESLGQ